MEDDARAFVEDSRRYTEQGDLMNVDAILQASVSANYDLYHELKRRDPKMCEAMKILMKEEIEEALQDAHKTGEAIGEAIGEARGQAKGEMKAKRETAFELADMGFTIEKIAQAVRVNVETVKSWFSEMSAVAK